MSLKAIVTVPSGADVGRTPGRSSRTLRSVRSMPVVSETPSASSLV